MKFTLNINLTVPTTKSGKSGFFAEGEAAQKKLYTAEHIPSSAGEWGLIFTLLPLALAAGGILPSLPGMAHSATVGGGHHHPTGNCKPSHRQGVWTTSTSGSVRPPGSERETHRKVWGTQNMAPQKNILCRSSAHKPSTRCCSHNFMYRGSDRFTPREMS
jgi:hypothetical protein